MKRIIVKEDQARSKIKEGIELAVNLIAPTLGAGTRKIIIDKEYGKPEPKDDGAHILQEIKDLEDRQVQVGVNLLQEIANQTNDKVGDGTTTSAILGSALISQLITKDNPLAIDSDDNELKTRKELEAGVEKVIKFVDKNKVEIISDDQTFQVARVASNSDEIGKVLSEFVKKFGKDVSIVVDDSDTIDISYELVEGMRFNNGFISPYFMTNSDKELSEIKEPYVLVTNHRLINPKHWETLTQLITDDVNNLVIISEEVDDVPLKGLIFNVMQGNIKALAVKAPGFGNGDKYLQDIAVLTGAKFIDKATDDFDKITKADLGRAKKVTATQTQTTIIDGQGDKKAIQARIKTLETQREDERSAFEKEKLEERISKLSGGVGILKVGAPTEIEREEKKEKIDDAIHAVKAALDDGIVAGGGVILLRASQILDEEIKGEKILKEAVQKPFKQIINNAGLSSKTKEFSEAILRNENINYGYNTETEEFGDLMKLGIIDPAGVTKTALRNAVSIALLVSSISGAIVLKEEKKDDKNEVAE